MKNTRLSPKSARPPKKNKVVLLSIDVEAAMRRWHVPEFTPSPELTWKELLLRRPRPLVIQARLLPS